MHDARSASESDFPYGWPSRVCYIHVADDGQVQQFNSRLDTRAYLANPTGRLFATWPGQWSTDLFLIDPAVMAKEMGIEVSV
jgi:hypothetical protein